jgi:tetratricopeptide (TPR) repeat protein
MVSAMIPRSLVAALLAAALLAAGAPAQDTRTRLEAHLKQAQALLDGERYREAIGELRAALALHAQIPGAYYQVGFAHWQLGEDAEAEAAFLRELEFKPPDPYSLYYLGRIRAKAGEAAGAIGHFEQALAAGDILDVRQQLASAYLSAGRVEQAVRLLEESLERRAEDGGLHYLLGRAYRQQGNTVAARRHFELAEKWKNKAQDEIRSLMNLRQLLEGGQRGEALTLARRLSASGDGEILVAVGMALGQHGLHDEAQAALEKAVRLEPRNAEAHYNLGRTYALEGDAGRAVPSLEKAVELKPELYEARAFLGALFAQSGNNEAAIRHLRAASELRPDNPKLLAALGLEYLGGRYFQEAVEALSKAAALDSGNPDLRFLLIQAYYRNQDFERALELADRTRADFPDLTLSHLHLGAQLNNLGRFAEAAKALEAALARDASLVEARLMLGEVLFKQGQAEASVAQYEAALTRNATLVDAYAGIARALVQLKRYEAAIGAVERGIGIDPDAPSLHLYLAQAYRALGRIEEAKAATATFTRLNRERAKARDKDVERIYVP